MDPTRIEQVSRRIEAAGERIVDVLQRIDHALTDVTAIEGTVVEPATHPAAAPVGAPSNAPSNTHPAAASRRPTRRQVLVTIGAAVLCTVVAVRALRR